MALPRLIAFTRSMAVISLMSLLPLMSLLAPVAAQDPAPPPASPTFEEFLAGVRADALARGLKEATVDAALATVVEPSPVVVARDRAQPERVRSLEDYIGGWMTPRTLETARAMARTHADVLAKVSRTYDIPAPMLVSVWGLESNFGRFTGTYPTVQALATLAFDPRRSQLFRRELLEALTILDRGIISLEEMKGSWAGAMGQPQFMPSSYLKHAVDFDGDGRADIWQSHGDVFASIANYLKTVGWNSEYRWGREVRTTQVTIDRIERLVPMRRTGCGALKEMTEARPLRQWTTLGVRTATGAVLPDADITASLVRGQSRSFLVYQNYLTILDYNCSNSYAISVGLLSDRIPG
jgi:membrane-bound lytic murein transglycosylase B